jgi:serine phosphatase RsbU (regulator of sigma subunit)
MSVVSDRVLIHSEHKEYLGSLVEQLDSLQLKVTVADSSNAVIDELMCSQFDLLILDAHRLDILKRLRDEFECNTPIIALAEADELGFGEECVRLGAKDFLIAPFHPTLVKVRVTGVLEMNGIIKEQLERERLLKLEHDVEIARRIQQNFLPRELPRTRNWEIEARFYPARMVAGDWYDAFHMANKRKIGFLVADVCDKGLPAALFMALSRSLIRSFSQQNQSLSWMDTVQFQSDDWVQSFRSNLKPAKEADQALVPRTDDRHNSSLSAGTTSLKSAVKLTNRYILDNHADSNMFFTLFFGVLDPTSGNITYINAGHNAPFVVDSQGKIKARLKPGGPAVGIMPGADFEIRQVDLDPGDIMYVFTDGVPDAANPAGERFSDKRLAELIQQQPGISAKELLDLVDKTVFGHIKDAVQFDDITMMAVRFLPER